MSRTPLVVLKDVERQIEENKGKQCIGIPFPWPQITEVTSGLRKGLLYVVGGYTSVGKSAFANEVVYNAMRNDCRCIVFSLEMSIETTMLRLAARHSGVPTLDILIGKFGAHQWEKIQDGFRLMESTDLLVVDDLYHLKKMRQLVARRQEEDEVDLVVIDFIQNVMGDSSIYARMAQAAIDSQALARDLKVPLLVMSQVDNESVRNPSGVIGYKGAGEIAAAADVGFWLEKKKGEGAVRCEIRKHRHGKITNLDLFFRDQYTRLGDGIVPIAETKAPHTFPEESYD